MKIAYVYDAVCGAPPHDPAIPVRAYSWIKGGAEKRIWEISKRLVERGHEVHLFGMKWWKGEDKEKW